jgi:hypothetical protein
MNNDVNFYKLFINNFYIKIRMTSIYDIPYEDIEKFLLANNINYENENDAYNKASELLKDKKAIGHTINIIEWMIAHNLLIRKINIPNYTTNEINKMSQNEINKLAKLLTMKGNNVENIKNILRYLHKLNNKNIILLPEINDIILQNLEKLEIGSVEFDTLKFNGVINLLKTHHNKALIRKLIYNNLEKILFYNLLIIDVQRLDDLDYIESFTYKLPKSAILELIRINEKNLLKNYTVEEINSSIDYIEGGSWGVNGIEIYRIIEVLADFLINLIEIKEIVLAKKVFYIANEYKFRGKIAYTYYSFNQYLVEILTNQKDDIFNILLDFIGEDDFIIDFKRFIIQDSNNLYIKLLLNKLIKLEKYGLFMKVLDLLILKNYNGSGQVINIILPRLQKAIEIKNNNLLIKYLNILNSAIDGKLRLGGDRRLNIINKLIENAEQDGS